MLAAAAVGEDQKGQHLLEARRLLEVDGADFEVENEDARGRLRADDVARELQRVHGRVAAHEADHGALDRGIEVAALHEIEVQPGRVQPGARRDHHVGDAPPIRPQVEAGHRAFGQVGGVLLVEAHPLGGARKVPATVDAGRVHRRSLGIVGGGADGVAVGDLRLVDEAVEDGQRARILQQRPRKTNEGLMAVVGRNGRGDAVDVRNRGGLPGDGPVRRRA